MKKILIIFLFLLINTSCKKYVDPGQPKNLLSRDNLFSDDLTATGAVLSLYSQLEGSLLLGNMVLISGLTGDEFVNVSSTISYQDVYNNNIVSGANITDQFWQTCYKIIYQCNSIIEGAKSSKGLSSAVKNQLVGEALFIRAYCHFLLINYYGSIPIVTNTNYQENSSLKQSTFNEVYEFIVEDLRSAEGLLGLEYKSANNANSSERCRVNKAAVQALLAKVYLYFENWDQAELFAEKVIDSSANHYLLEKVKDAFLKGSKEQIWQVQPVFSGLNTYVGFLMILTGEPYLVYFDRRNIDLFDANDKRRSEWISSYSNGVDTFFYSNKYKIGLSTVPNLEYTSILRLADVILVRAEARVFKGDILGAVSDINLIRKRAGISEITSITKSALIDSIMLERRRELFAEGSNRWFDIKRSGSADSIMRQVKSVNWQPTDVNYPIPLYELQKNRNLVQNPGY